MIVDDGQRDVCVFAPSLPTICRARREIKEKKKTEEKRTEEKREKRRPEYQRGWGLYIHSLSLSSAKMLDIFQKK